MTRQYLTDAQKEWIVKLKADGHTFTEIGATVGARPETVRMFLKRQGGGRSNGEDAESASLKTRLLRLIAEQGPFAGVPELMAQLRQPGDNHGPHEVVHLLYSLNKQGLIVFNTSRVGGNELLVKIRAKPAGFAAAGYSKQEVPHVDQAGGFGHYLRESPVAVDDTDFRRHSARAKGGPITHTRVAPVSPPANEEPTPTPKLDEVPTSPVYPVLVALRQREADSSNARRAAELLAEAAELTGDMDLLERAATIEAAAAFSATEQEYLRYAADHS